ncbi:MAG: Lrp/AsnC family transcriptional regulator [Candidatus Woesearchaeota archaeon]|jgi:Lrp/AsnC family transcriptional regulator for asnA, asnC and gidA|nr:Lrp/AsnC family transcriptional regulator [Candidatus Woesearchaeota archaeon]
MVDTKDQTILDMLEENARISFTQIAKKLNISEAAIRKRVKKLEKEEIILGYKASVNYKKLGYSNKIIMGVDTTPKDYFKVMNILKDFSYIKNLTTSSGDHMIMFEVWVKGMKELNKIMEEINGINGVTESCPSIIHEDIN